MTGLVVGAIIISFSSIMVKLANVPPDVAGFYRLFVGGLGLLAVLAGTGKLSRFSKHIWKWSIPTAVFFAADFYCWHRAIGYVGPGLATMLGNFQVIIVAVVSVLFLKERATKLFFASIGLALTGLYLMVGLDWTSLSSEFQLGVILGLLTGLAYAFYLLSLKFSLARTDADPLATSCAVALGTGVILAGLALAKGDSFVIPDTQSLAALATLALVCHAGGWFLITRSLQNVRASLVGLTLLLQPTLSMVWDILFFDRPTNMIELIGIGLALTGIYLGSLKPQTD